ncbi:MAG: ATP-binding protein, partial [Deltaproteobacteria bacterium]|nr:ATP-binding protein [Deltaproteobacteria bacterium]
PYYAQALAYNIFEISGDTVSEDDIQSGFNNMLASERYGYEAVVQGLTGSQIALLKALAVDPVSKILSTKYMNRYRLSAGGIQYARNKLEKLDLIEKHNNIWKIVDPVFGCWLVGY